MSQQWIAFCSDDELPASTAIFVVTAADSGQATALVNALYETNLNQTISTLRLAEIDQGKPVQFIGYPMSNEDAQAILALSQEVLAIASEESDLGYADKLRALVRNSSLGRYAYNVYYGTKKAED